MSNNPSANKDFYKNDLYTINHEKYMNDFDKIVSEFDYKFDFTKVTDKASFIVGQSTRMMNGLPDPSGRIKDRVSYMEGYRQTCEALLSAPGYKNSRFVI